jgi:hypothetical protein
MREWQAHDAVTEPVDVTPPPPAKKYDLGDYLFQFIVITAGVLIALLLNGLVEWNNNRELVAQARATIAQEIAQNKNDMDKTLAGIGEDMKRFDNALKFATDMLTAKKTSITELMLHLNFADVSSAGWRTAERTGALSHMPYAEVQRYSLLYDLQDLYTEQQRAMLLQLAEASAILSGDFDPDHPNPKDLEVFRDRVMQLQSTLKIHEQMARRLAERYAEALAQ